MRGYWRRKGKRQKGIRRKGDSISKGRGWEGVERGNEGRERREEWDGSDKEGGGGAWPINKKIVPAPMSTVAIRLLKVCCMCCVCAQYCVVSVRRTRSPVSPRPSTLIRWTSGCLRGQHRRSTTIRTAKCNAAHTLYLSLSLSLSLALLLITSLTYWLISWSHRLVRRPRVGRFSVLSFVDTIFASLSYRAKRFSSRLDRTWEPHTDRRPITIA